MSTEVEDAFEEISDELDIKAGDLTDAEYREFLESLQSEVEVRLQALTDEGK